MAAADRHGLNNWREASSQMPAGGDAHIMAADSRGLSSVIVVAGMGLAVGVTVLTILAASDPLRRDVLAAFITAPAVPARGEGGMNIVTVMEAPTGVARGVQIGLAALLVGGVPAAFIGRALAAGTSRSRRRWSGGWRSAFLAGFAFQVSSVAFSLSLLVLVLWIAYDAGATAREVFPI